jgi:hypothetical protein
LRRFPARSLSSGARAFFTREAHMTKLSMRSPLSQADAWEQRTLLVKKEMAAESAANDAKTVRLRALRLEKERQDAEAQGESAAAAPPAPQKRARAKRILVR